MLPRFGVTKFDHAYTNGQLLSIMSNHAYHRMKILYVGYIGILDTATSHPVYKYGITRNIHQRFLQHAKAFPSFQPRIVCPTLYNDIVEQLFTTELRIRGLHRTHSINNRHHRELFVTTCSFTLLDVHDLLRNLTLKAEKEYPIWMTK